jgi:hypothetical protein
MKSIETIAGSDINNSNQIIENFLLIGGDKFTQQKVIGGQRHINPQAIKNEFTTTLLKI